MKKIKQFQVSSPSPDWRGPVSGPPGPGPARVKLPPPGFHTNSAAPHQLPHTNLGYGGQGGYGAGPGLNLPPVSSNAVDSLFGLGPGPVRQRSGGPAPGFGGHAPQGAGQELLFGLGGGAKAGAGLDLGGPNRLGLGGLKNDEVTEDSLVTETDLNTVNTNKIMAAIGADKELLNAKAGIPGQHKFLNS